VPQDFSDLPEFTSWPTFPFEGSFRVRGLDDTVEVEPDRQGEGGDSCHACETPDSAYIWVADRWRVRAMERPSGLPMVLILESRSHLDLGDLPNLLAAELGVMTVRLERAIRSLEGVARVHVNRWGDGSAHLHLWFLARPYGRLQLRGTFLSLWDDILPPIDEVQWRENLGLVAAWLADFGGRSLADAPHIDWQSPSSLDGDLDAMVESGFDRAAAAAIAAAAESAASAAELSSTEPTFADFQREYGDAPAPAEERPWPSDDPGVARAAGEAEPDSDPEPRPDTVVRAPDANGTTAGDSRRGDTESSVPGVPISSSLNGSAEPAAGTKAADEGTAEPSIAGRTDRRRAPRPGTGDEGVSADGGMIQSASVDGGTTMRLRPDPDQPVDVGGPDANGQGGAEPHGQVPEPDPTARLAGAVTTPNAARADSSLPRPAASLDSSLPRPATSLDSVPAASTPSDSAPNDQIGEQRPVTAEPPATAPAPRRKAAPRQRAPKAAVPAARSAAKANAAAADLGGTVRLPPMPDPADPEEVWQEGI
jgi:hypothetical protein